LIDGCRLIISLASRADDHVAVHIEKVAMKKL
jgi:hypothetical protein